MQQHISHRPVMLSPPIALDVIQPNSLSDLLTQIVVWSEPRGGEWINDELDLGPQYHSLESNSMFYSPYHWLIFCFEYELPTKTTKAVFSKGDTGLYIHGHSTDM